MLFEGDYAKLVTPTPIEKNQVATLRMYLNQDIKRSIIERDTDNLTKEEFKTHEKEVEQSTYDELKVWIEHDCFDRRPRKGATNILDIRWVAKWKWIKIQKFSAK